MNEAETRAEHIDPALRAAGWGVVDGSRIMREYHITPGRIEGGGRKGKAEIADYVLVYKNTKLAVVEAKAWGKELTEGVAQAKSYAGKLEIRFTYATNGQGIYAVDMEEGKEGDAVSYPSPGELWGMTFAKKNEWRERFADVPFEDKGGFFQGRYDQGAGLLPPLLQARQLRVHFAQHLGNRSLFGERWELDLDQLQRLFVKRVTFHCLFSIRKRGLSLISAHFSEMGGDFCGEFFHLVHDLRERGGVAFGEQADAAGEGLGDTVEFALDGRGEGGEPFCRSPRCGRFWPPSRRRQ
jgi:hypothetical protein